MDKSKMLKKFLYFFAAILFLVAVFLITVYLFTDKVEISADIIIQNAKVVTMDSQSHIYSPGFVVIANSKIIAVGQGRAPAVYKAKKVIDAGGKIAMPGLINAHSHAAMSLLTGLVKNQPLETWLKETSVYENKLTPEDVYWGSLLAEDKMIKSGITTFNDMYFFPEATASSSLVSGMRAVVRIPATEQDGKISFNENFVSQFGKSPLINFSVDPNPLLNYSLSELSQFSTYAKNNNYLVHIHFDEDAQTRVDALAKYGKTPLELISEAGFTTNKLVLAHAGDLNAQEAQELFKLPNVGLAFCPLSEQNLQTPPTPVKEMLGSNIPVSLGTDGELGSSLNMFDQISMALEQGLSPKQAVEMGTISGAKVLGLNNLVGSLEVNKQADIILVKNQQGDDIYSSLVYNTTEADVTNVIVAGKLVMEDGKVLTINEQELAAKTANITARLKGE